MVKQVVGVSISFIWQLKSWRILYIVGGRGLRKQRIVKAAHKGQDKAVIDVSLL